MARGGPGARRSGGWRSSSGAAGRWRARCSSTRRWTPSTTFRRPASAGSPRAPITPPMSAVETPPQAAAARSGPGTSGWAAAALERPRARRRSDARWALALAALLAGAFVLRVWGARQGLPYAYNADENAHFVPKAIGLFGHSLNPDYFVNPPAFTYLLHAVFAVWYGGGGGGLPARALPPAPGFVFRLRPSPPAGRAGPCAGLPRRARDSS